MKKIRFRDVKIKYVLTDRKMPDAMEPIEFDNKHQVLEHVFKEEFRVPYCERKDKKITLNKLLKMCGYKVSTVVERIPA